MRNRSIEPCPGLASKPPAASLAALVLALVALQPALAQTRAAESEAAFRLPDEALELELLDVTSGERQPVGQWRGSGGLLVVFLSNTCPYVLDWADRFPALAARTAEQNLGLVAVNSNARKRRATDSPGEMRAFAAEHLGDLPYLLDEDSRLADLLGARRTPEALLFDAELELVYRGPIDDHSGPIAEVEHHWLQGAVEGLAEGGVIPESQPPIGCGIQRPRRR